MHASESATLCLSPMPSDVISDYFQCLAVPVL